MSKIRKICVYCGSSTGTDPAWLAAARRLGRLMAEHRIGLVYGGGSNGLMGAVATAVVDHGGEVVGVIPEFLRTKENMFDRATELIVTHDMHERKRIMFEQADAFVALPGGIGTLEELVEQLTWAQLGRHRKPILLADIGGFWQPLVDVLERMRDAGFIHNGALMNYRVCSRVDDILPTLAAAVAPVSEREKAGDAETVEKL
ncbi:TIGR00730 family Rossman fold protein [Rhodoplanes roseus]|uniref:Cytokinin riboside 5'-monophosphate phosphoribohydrolase n=1 Tax=Rhodoplanes roseus TaxID=29409 RepID=A0A327KNI7_9BRAD|nr:TIGR00730 family Rossman fold protein [Rhodoplanes roseus]RAI39901.1 TIGR00730 family Rossman fold protein [Rhodoplanes roseus]